MCRLPGRRCPVNAFWGSNGGTVAGLGQNGHLEAHGRTVGPISALSAITREASIRVRAHLANRLAGRSLRAGSSSDAQCRAVKGHRKVFRTNGATLVAKWGEDLENGLPGRSTPIGVYIRAHVEDHAHDSTSSRASGVTTGDHTLHYVTLHDLPQYPHVREGLEKGEGDTPPGTTTVRARGEHMPHGAGRSIPVPTGDRV